MSYTPNTWANGDVITAGKLNAMESGISGADTAAGNAATAAASAATAAANADKIYFINVVSDGEDDEITYTSDKTLAEILAAIQAGKFAYVYYDGGYYPLDSVNTPYATYFSRNYVADDILYSEMFTIEMGVEETDTDVSYAVAEYTLTPAE